MKTTINGTPTNNGNKQETNNQPKEGYHNLTASGIGKMHYTPAENGKPAQFAVRPVSRADGNSTPFYGVKISGLYGKKDKPQYSQFDLTINSDSPAFKTLEKVNDRAAEVVEATNKRVVVTVRFQAGDIRAKAPYQRKSDNSWHADIGGRLLKITHAWVGNEVIIAPEAAPAATDNAAATSANDEVPY